MGHTLDTIDTMRIFASVAAARSFTGGGKRLGISTKVTSKAVQQLEQRLQAQLFNRTTRSVQLTDVGQAYLERCLTLLDQFDELEGLVQIKQSELAGSIRLTAPTAFGGRQLIDALTPFQKQHPKVTIDMHLSDQRVAVVEDGFDLAIRFGKLEDSSLIARKLMNMRIVVFASPDYLEQHGTPQDPKALSTHNCLMQRTSDEAGNWIFSIDGEITTIRVSGSFQANSPRAIAHMASKGLGIGKSPVYVVEPYLKEGTLELLFEDNEATEFALYAIYPPNRHLTARVRALIDHLAAYYHS